MRLLSQRDVRWGSVTLGDTIYTVSRWGCTITSISMLLDYFKKWRSPGELAKLLSFTKDGLVIWSSLERVGFMLEKRVYYEDKKMIDAALRHPEKGCLLQVEHFHWVLLVGKTLTGDYRVADPWTGEIIKMRSRYKFVSGFAIIKNL